MFRGAAGLCSVLFLLLAGCTKDEDYYEVFREQRANLKEIADVLATVKDEKSMAEAKDALAEKTKKYEAAARKANALPKPPPAHVRERLQDEKAIMESRLRELQKQVIRVRGLPGGDDFLKRFDSDSPGLFSAVQP